jgi:hemoglobin-like flavoprotein
VDEQSLVIGASFNNYVAGKDDPLELFELKGFKKMDLQLELQASLNLLLKDEDHFAKLFYEKVFSIAPEARALFRNNMTDQGRLLTHMLGGIVYSLSRPKHLKTGLKKLGQSHVKYGVRAAHYPIVKQAMIDTIDEVLGENKTEKSIDAWNNAFDFVIDTMQKHAEA